MCVVSVAGAEERTIAAAAWCDDNNNNARARYLADLWPGGGTAVLRYYTRLADQVTIN